MRALGPSAAAERGLMRIFVAVFPPSEVQERAAELVERLRSAGDGVSWVKRENLHYTIRFLGDLGEDGSRCAARAVQDAASTALRFAAALGAPGAFPSAKRARVLWLGLAEGGEPLTALARAVERALETAGFGRAERPFAPHLTIGRVRTSTRDWAEPLAAAIDSRPPVAFTVDRVVVVHSTLSPQGSVYRVRAEAPLAS